MMESHLIGRNRCWGKYESSGLKHRYLLRNVILWIFSTIFFSLMMTVSGIDTPAQLRCTPPVLRRGLQCFSILPKPVVYAAMGDTVELKCAIRNLKGHVQWIHNISGFLGSEDVPIQKTYAFSYLGNIANGEKHLQIRNLSLTLQGKYECQVPPSPNILRAATHVVVLVQPSVPKIYANGVPIHNNAKVSINPKSSNQEFVCTTVGGNPVPKIAWYRMPRGVTRFSPSERMRIKRDGGTRKSSTSSDILTTTYQNRLLMTRGSLRNVDKLVCVVKNEATKRHHDRNRRYLKTTVRVELQRKPGRPVIDQRRRKYYEGDRFMARCKARVGVPSGSLIWRQKLADGTEQRQFVGYKTGTREMTNQLVIPSLTRMDHNSRLICEASNDVTDDALTQTLNLKVMFPPRTLTIHSENRAEQVRTLLGGGRETVVYGRSGSSKTLTCRTDLFYPNATITWLRGNRRISPQSDRIIPKDGAYILESNITVRFTREDNNRYYDCRAFGVKGGRGDARVKLSIMYPPGKPYITGHRNNTAVDTGRRIKVTCVSIGGSPQPNLLWFRADTNEMVDGEPLRTLGDRRTRDLKITVSRQDNGDRYYCVAHSEAMTKQLRSRNYQINVRFPPEKINISIVGRSSTNAGDIALILCKAATSNPGAVIRWKQINCTKRGRCTTSNREASEVESLSGHYNGVETHSQLRLRTRWIDDGTFVECEAFNPKLDAPSLNDRVKLNVTYAPKFRPPGRRLNNYAVQKVREGSNKTLDMGVMANPPPTFYNWMFGGEIFKGSARVFPVNGKLILRGIKRSDAGNYTLIVGNERGNAQLNFFLDITYPPTMIGPSRVKISIKEDFARLDCKAHANPPVIKGFEWRRVDSLSGNIQPRLIVRCNEGRWNKTFKYFVGCELSKSLESITVPEYEIPIPPQKRIESTLVIYSFQPRDVGYYQCIVNNGIGKSAVKIFEVIIPFKPIMTNKPSQTKAAGELGRSVSLKCIAEGEPGITFSWFRGPENLTLTAGPKYRISSQRRRPGLYETVLRIHNLQRSDHGIYFCQGSNIVGTSTLRLRVSGTGAPDIPSYLRLLNATDRSILVQWTQGFDGGSPQTFTIRWREVDVSLYQYRDVARVPSEEIVEYVISGLKSGKKYEISINARNKLHGPSPYCRPIFASTKPALGPVDRSLGKGAFESDMPVLIIVAACVFAFIVLVINIIVVAFILRRRGHCGGTLPGSSRKDRVNQNGKGVIYLKPGSDAYELRSSHGGDGSYRRGSLQGDDDKTYSSYDATSDEVRDLIKKYPNEMLVPHNAYVDLLYPANSFRQPGLAPIGETQLMKNPCALQAGAMLAATMDQPTLMARPSPMARTSPSSLSANSHERVPTTFQPIVLLNQHANSTELPMVGYSSVPGAASPEILPNGYRSGSLTTFPSASMANAEAQQRHSYAEELRRVQYNAALAAGLQPGTNNLSSTKPSLGNDSNSSTLNSHKTSTDMNLLPNQMPAYPAPGSSRGSSPIVRQMPSPPSSVAMATVNPAASSSADTVIRYTPNGGTGNVTSSILRPGNDYMV